ncbi:MAG TPA: hypothetical protein VGC76_15935 [Pyrinomonadaceae bacterium]|jgi:hypothetical protein
MNKFLGVFFAFAMILSVAFVSNSFSASAQGKVVVKKTKSIASKTWGGTKYVYRKGAQGTRYVYRKTKNGTVYVGRQSVRGGKWTYGKAKGGTKAVISRTKKIVTQ